MPSFFLVNSTQFTGSPDSMGAETGASFVIGRSATVGFLGGSMVMGSGANQSVTVLGAAVAGLGAAIDLDGANARILIASTGSAIGAGRADGVLLELRSAAQTTQITNEGEIIGDRGIAAAGSVVIDNSGQIESTGRGVSTGSPLSVIDAAIHLSDPFANFVYSATIQNTGEIAAALNAAGTHFAGRRMAIYDGQGVIAAGGGATTTVENDGIIRGDVWLGTLNDRVDNTGRIIGRVDMGTGNDLVENSGRITGSVLLGDGRDAYTARERGDALGLIDGGAGDDVLRGASAADTLAGGAGADILTGGAGADVFQFRAGDTTAAARDTITDFRRGDDLIDLSRIDARPTVTGDQAFTFVGQGALGTTAGRLRYDPATGVISAELDGIAGADLAILLLSRPATLGAADFLL